MHRKGINAYQRHWRVRGALAAAAAIAVAAVLSACGTGQEAQDVGEAEPVLEWDASPDTTVIELREDAPMVAGPDAPPLLRVQGDGAVLVHYPEGSAKAGDSRGELDPEGLRDLLGELVDLGVMQFDANEAKEAIRAAREARGPQAPIPVTMDASTTRLRIQLERYASAGQAQAEPDTDFVKEIEWYNLDSDAREHPGVDALQELQKAVDRLKTLAEDVRMGTR